MRSRKSFVYPTGTAAPRAAFPCTGAAMCPERSVTGSCTLTTLDTPELESFQFDIVSAQRDQFAVSARLQQPQMYLCSHRPAS
jgi:hypothetical protein